MSCRYLSNGQPGYDLTFDLCYSISYLSRHVCDSSLQLSDIEGKFEGLALYLFSQSTKLAGLAGLSGSGIFQARPGRFKAIQALEIGPESSMRVRMRTLDVLYK